MKKQKKKKLVSSVHFEIFESHHINSHRLEKGGINRRITF